METPAWHLEAQKITAAAGGLKTDVDQFFFLRHGETEHNKQRIIQTQRGVTLNDTGRGQARAAAQIASSVSASVSEVLNRRQAARSANRLPGSPA